MTTTQPDGDFPCCTAASTTSLIPAPAEGAPLPSVSPRELFDNVESGAAQGDFPHFTAALDAYVAQACAVAANEAWAAAFAQAAHILAMHHPASATLLTAHAATSSGENGAVAGPAVPRMPAAGPAGTAPATLLVGVEDCTVRTYQVTSPVPVELLTPGGEEQPLIDWLNDHEELWRGQCTAPCVPVRSDPATMGLVVVDVTIQDQATGRHREDPGDEDRVFALDR